MVVGLLATAAGASLPVLEVELRSDASTPRAEELRGLAAFPLGRPLDPVDVRRAVVNLLATGIPAEVEVYSEEIPGGARVVVAMWLNVMVDEVHIEGELGLPRSRLRREVAVVAGGPLLEDRVLRSVFHLQDLYRAEGYLAARVRAQVEVDDAARTARVTLAVESGERARVAEIELAGEWPGLSESKLRELLGLAAGDAYREKAARQAADRLREGLIELGYRLASAELEEEAVESGGGTAVLRYRVEVGPRVEVEVVGADRRKLERKGLLPFLGREGYDEGLVQTAVEELRTHYQRRGHYRVGVESAEEQGEGWRRLTLTIQPGEVYEISSVSFEGGEAIGAETLAQLMETAPRRGFAPRSGRLVDAVLAADLENLRSYLMLSGWTSATVRSRVEESGRELAVTVAIEAGVQRRVVSVSFGGVEALDLTAVAGELPVQPGGPFHPRRVEDAVAQLRAAYEELGFVWARVRVAEDWNEDESLVDLIFEVEEGPQRTAGRLITSGLWRTRPAVVRKAVALTPGEPLSPGRLLEIQRHLYQLGIFSRARVSLAPGAEWDTSRDVVAEVEEGRNQRLLYGLGYDSEEGIGGLVGYSHANLGGRAARLQLDLRASQRSERYRLVLSQRRGAAFAVSTRFTLFDQDDQRPGFEVASRGAQIELSRDLGALDVGLFFDLRRVDLTQLAAELPEEIERDQRDVDIASLIPRVLWDRRDDPIDPKRGWLTTAQLQLAFPILGAEEEFTKLFLQQSTYHQLPILGVLAWSLRAGAIEPRGDRPVAIAERFFAGGRTTHRAYARDGLGIRGKSLDDDGDPLGGNGLLLANLDWRFPIVGAFGGTLFVDAGNVWADWREFDPGEIRLGAGVGLRFLSPIGPLRLEVGWKLDRQPGESPSEIFVSFGNAF